MKGLIKIKGTIIYWLVSLLVYAILLACSANFEVWSLVYHLALLLFPLLLLLFKKESLASLGLVKGDSRQGLRLLLIIVVSLVGGVYLRAWLLKKSVKIVFSFSLLFVNAVILAPLAEEIFHRGLLQTKLVKVWKKDRGIVFSAILFSLIHVPKLLFAQAYVSLATPLPLGHNFIVALISFFIMGMFFGYIYQLTRSVYYAILGHIIINFILLTFLY